MVSLPSVGLFLFLLLWFFIFFKKFSIWDGFLSSNIMFSFFCLYFSKYWEKGASSSSGSFSASVSFYRKFSFSIFSLGLGFGSDLCRLILTLFLVSSSWASKKWLQTRKPYQLSPLASKCSSMRILISL